jgi:hypothetical protein
MCPVQAPKKSKTKSPKGRRRRRKDENASSPTGNNISGLGSDGKGAQRLPQTSSSLPMLQHPGHGSVKMKGGFQEGSLPESGSLPDINKPSQDGSLMRATADMDVLKKVLSRESMLSSIQSAFKEACRAKSGSVRRGASIGSVELNEFALLAITGKMKIFREVTVETTEAIAHWQQQMARLEGATMSYNYKGNNYLAKMIVDLDFLAESPTLTEHWGFPLGTNPLLLSDAVREELTSSDGSSFVFQHVDGVDSSRVWKAHEMISAEQHAVVDLDQSVDSAFAAEAMSSDIGPEYSPSNKKHNQDQQQGSFASPLELMPPPPTVEIVGDESLAKKKGGRKSTNNSPSRRRKKKRYGDRLKKKKNPSSVVVKPPSGVWKPSDKRVAHANDKADMSWLASNKVDKNSAFAHIAAKRENRKSKRVASHIVPKADLSAKLLKMQKDIALSEAELEQKQQELAMLRESCSEFVTMVKDWKTTVEEDAAEAERANELARGILLVVDPEMACRTFTKSTETPITSEPAPVLIRDWNLSPEQYEQREILYEMFATGGLTRKRAKKVLEAGNETICKREREVWLRNEELLRKNKVRDYNQRFMEREAKKNAAEIKGRAMQDHAALKIQMVARQRNIERRAQDRANQKKGALTIQSCSRARAGRQQVQAKRDEKNAAVAIQTRARGRADRKRANIIGEKRNAAVTVQGQVRRQQARKNVQELKTVKTNAAVSIQNRARGKNAQKRVGELKQSNAAAVTIQGKSRQKKAKARVHEKRAERGAIVIQGKARQRTANARVSQLREEQKQATSKKEQDIAREYVISISMQAIRHVLEIEQRATLEEIQAFVANLLDKTIQTTTDQIVKLALCTSSQSISINTFATQYICGIIQNTLDVFDRPAPNQTTSSTGLKNCVGCKLRNGEFALLVIDHSQLTKGSTSYNIFTINGMLLSNNNSDECKLEPTSLSEDEVNLALELGGMDRMDSEVLQQPVETGTLADIAKSCAMQMEVALFRDDTRSNNLQMLVFHDSFVSSFKAWQDDSTASFVVGPVYTSIGCRIGTDHFVLLRGMIVPQDEANPVISVQLGGMVMSGGNNLENTRLEETIFSVGTIEEALFGLTSTNSASLLLAEVGAENIGASLRSAACSPDALQIAIKECAPALVLLAGEGLDSAPRLGMRVAHSEVNDTNAALSSGTDEVVSGKSSGVEIGCKIGTGEFVLLRGKIVLSNPSDPHSTKSLSLRGVVLSGGGTSLDGCCLNPSLFSIEEIKQLSSSEDPDLEMVFMNIALDNALDILRSVIRSCASSLGLDAGGPRLVSRFAPMIVSSGKIADDEDSQAATSIQNKHRQRQAKARVEEIKRAHKGAAVIQSKHRSSSSPISAWHFCLD